MFPTCCLQVPSCNQRDERASRVLTAAIKGVIQMAELFVIVLLGAGSLGLLALVVYRERQARKRLWMI